MTAARAANASLTHLDDLLFVVPQCSSGRLLENNPTTSPALFSVGVALSSHMHVPRSSLSNLMSFSHAHLIYRAAIAAVSPLSLVAQSVNFDPRSCVLNIGDHSYTLNKSVNTDNF